ncbi:universal stress protein [Halobaculum gomorrense]|uniref:Nucleotide-binding universal stress protein, UspA family n=1 Tax=Halobaculum gomorrense TaxID=43928 RepID=A0A1M5RJY0_9EURY|nr:universal stress protein [Halobaculum gomorrense]SHH26510.1 Nucleotide-binding universal stress protein, UspA family [Halobaculum gomorrense]
MDHALAVVGPTETAKTLTREAGELAAGVGADLTLLHITDEDDYDEQREQLAQVTRGDSTYSVGQAVEGARAYASDIGREVLEDVDIDYETVGTVGDRAETVVAEARRRGCDHVFIAGRKRSPTGKALFGDDTQRIILDAEMPVTVVTE